MTYKQLLTRYLKKHHSLVEPNQGFHSLHDSLWLAYSMGRKRSFTDLGTYARKPGDHSWGDRNGKPGMALAYDLGRKNRFFNKGWNYWVARKYAKLLQQNARALNIQYIILGDRIWNIDRASEGWRYFSNFPNDRSHLYHIHVSGRGWA